VLGVVLARTTRDGALVVPPGGPADLRTGQHETSQPGKPLSHNGIRARRYSPPMHMSASILGRWLSLVRRGDRSVTGWQWTVSTGRTWTICLVWSTWKVDVAFARVAMADGRWAGAPAASRPATHGLACAAQTPAIPKEPEESGPMILIAMPAWRLDRRATTAPGREQLRTAGVAQRRGPGAQGIGS